MLSIHCNSCIKSRKNWKKFLKNIKIKPFIDEHNWEGINSPSGKDDWKIFEKNKPTIALNVLYARNKKIYPASVSKHNSNREKQIHLAIPTGEGYGYFIAKKYLCY